jgi:hypothetical protein
VQYSSSAGVKVTLARLLTAMEIAGAPCNTAYSPHTIALPGALTEITVM